MKYDIRQISKRARGLADGGVIPEEVDFARELLRARSGDINSALYVVGLCGNANDEALIRSFVDGSENNLYVEIALKALCRYLGLTAKYRPVLRELVMAPPDEIGTRRMTAIHLMKEYFYEYDDDVLACHLVEIVCDFNDRHRRSARDALVDILELRAKIKDPIGANFDGWDEDTTLVVEEAKSAFNCGGIKIRGGHSVN